MIGIAAFIVVLILAGWICLGGVEAVKSIARLVFIATAVIGGVSAWLFLGAIDVIPHQVVAAGLIALVAIPLMYKLLYPVLRDHYRAITQQTNGRPAWAKVIRIAQTGLWVNENPRVELTVRVPNESGSLYTAKILDTIEVVHLSHYQPGAMVAVRIHRVHADRITLDHTLLRQAPPSGTDVSLRPETLVPGGPSAPLHNAVRSVHSSGKSTVSSILRK